MIKSYYRTDFLFAKSSFLSGMGSILDITGTYFRFNGSSSDQIADKVALESDFGAVGCDLREAVNAL